MSEKVECFEKINNTGDIRHNAKRSEDKNQKFGEKTKAGICFCFAGVAQLARARPCQGRGRGFEPHHPLQFPTHFFMKFG